jgi:hypothetical protein
MTSPKFIVNIRTNHNRGAAGQRISKQGKRRGVISVTYNEWRKAGGIGFGQREVSFYCQQHNMIVRQFNELPIEELVKEGGGYFQRFFTGKLLLQPNHVNTKVSAYVTGLCAVEYNRHLSCEHTDEHYGISCECGSYHNPNLKASQIYGSQVAQTWEVG